MPHHDLLSGVGLVLKLDDVAVSNLAVLDEVVMFAGPLPHTICLASTHFKADGAQIQYEQNCAERATYL